MLYFHNVAKINPTLLKSFIYNWSKFLNLSLFRFLIFKHKDYFLKILDRWPFNKDLKGRLCPFFDSKHALYHLFPLRFDLLSIFLCRIATPISRHQKLWYISRNFDQKVNSYKNSDRKKELICLGKCSTYHRFENMLKIKWIHKYFDLLSQCFHGSGCPFHWMSISPFLRSNLMLFKYRKWEMNDKALHWWHACTVRVANWWLISNEYSLSWYCSCIQGDIRFCVSDHWPIWNLLGFMCIRNVLLTSLPIGFCCYLVKNENRKETLAV